MSQSSNHGSWNSNRDPRIRGDALPPPYETDEADPFGWALMGSYIGFVLRAPRRHKLLALTVFAAVLAVAILLSLVMPVRYRVQTVVLAQRSQMSTLSNPGMNREWDVPTRAAREVVIRRDNLVALAKQVDLPERYLQTRSPIVRARDAVMELLTGQPRDPKILLEDLVDTLQSRLVMFPGPEGTITISLDWTNRALALDIVQAALQSFLEQRRIAEIEAVGESIAIFQAHDERVQQMIAVTVEQVERKDRSAHVRNLPRRASTRRASASGDQELRGLENTLATRRRALAELEALRQQRLAEMQAQLVQQQATYAPLHPILVGTTQAIATLSRPSPQVLALRAEERELEAEITRRGGRARDAAVGAPLGAPPADADLADASFRILQMEDPRLETERRQLEDLLRQHSGLLQRIDSARLEMDTAQAAFKYRYAVITPPLLPKTPIKPYTLLYVSGGVLAGLALALLSCTAVDIHRGRVLERWQIEKGLDLPILEEFNR